MAGLLSVCNEERNLQRIRERERRMLEAQPVRELYLEDGAPLFSEPYKTNKGDELSIRIQRMLGNYEDVRELAGNVSYQTPDSAPKSLQPSPSYGSANHTDRSQPLFQNAQLKTSQAEAANHSSNKPHMKAPPPQYNQVPFQYNSSSSSRGRSSPDCTGMSQGSSELSECLSHPPGLPVLTPPAEPLSPLHSSDASDTDLRDDGKDRPPSRRKTPRRHRYSGREDERYLDTHVDIPAQFEAASLPSQNFPPSLRTKSSLMMPQKPTAYVRPMDGQDHMPTGSPQLKPSPDNFHRLSYENVPDLKSNAKPSLEKLKISPRLAETSGDVLCVEEILREMTQSWPPLLTAIHTPSTADPPKLSVPKESQSVHSGVSGPQEAHEPSKVLPSDRNEESLVSQGNTALAHSSSAESARSSYSESTSGSESDSESSKSAREEPASPHRATSSQAKVDAPVANKWQLNNWLVKVNQQNSAADSLSNVPQCESPGIKRQLDEREDYRKNYVSHTPPLLPAFKNNGDRLSQECLHGQTNSRKFPPHANSAGKQKKVGAKHLSKMDKSSRTSDHKAGKGPDVVEEVLCDKNQDFFERPKVKVENASETTRAEMDPQKPDKCTSSKKKLKKFVPKGGVALEDKTEGVKRLPSPVQTHQPCQLVQTENFSVHKPSQKSSKKPKGHSSFTERKQEPLLKDSQTASCSLVVKLERNLLSRLPQPVAHAVQPSTKEPDVSSKKKPKTKKRDADWPHSKLSKKRPAEKDAEPLPAKKVKHDKDVKPSLSSHGSSTAETPKTVEKKSKKKVKKSQACTSQPAGQKVQKEAQAHTAEPTMQKVQKEVQAHTAEPVTQEFQKEAQAHIAESVAQEVQKEVPARTAQPALWEHKKELQAHTAHLAAEGLQKEAKKKRSAMSDSAAALQERSHTPAKHKHKRKRETDTESQQLKIRKKSARSSSSLPVPVQPSGRPLPLRPLLKFDNRQYTVEHHMKEAKKLKHKADATSDKVGKAFNYLDAAMSFVETGIAMETDPQTPKSAYTMFSETVDLIRFILKLKNSVVPSGPDLKRDFTVLCLRCQSLLQMAMFHQKRETALKYSRTLTEHFKGTTKFAQALSPSKSLGMNSPASPGSQLGGGCSGTVAIPQVIQQVAASYVTITTLFLCAHDTWEQAEALAQKGSRMLSELDSALGPLTLASNMSSLVRHTRQGLHWLRLDAT